MPKKNKPSSDEKVVVDFTGVEIGGGGSPRVPEGDYHFRVKNVEQRESEKGEPYLNFELSFLDKAHKSKTLFHICSLQPQALFNLRGTLVAMGMEVPQKRVGFTLSKLVGKELMGTVADDEYKGKIRSRIVDTFPVGGKPGGEADEEELGEAAEETDEEAELEDLEEL